MDFKTIIQWSGRLYALLEKFNLEKSIDVDALLDNNFPRIQSRLQSYIQGQRIAICQTNGKKTTTHLINEILKANNKTFITNINKDAKKYPLFLSMILALAKNPELIENDEKMEYLTASLDEYELEHYFNLMKFDYLLLGNLFVDQKDFLNLEEKREKIQKAIVLNSKLDLIINADEPMFYEIDDIKNDTLLSKKRKKIFYGFDSIEFFDNDNLLIQKNDLIKCPNCMCDLDYEKRYYSHLGHFVCECGFKRPRLDISAEAKIFSDYMFMNVFYEGNKYAFKLPFGGVYNAYNALGAISLALCLKIERKVIACAFENYETLNSRDEKIQYKNKTVKIKIIKNPTSLSEALRELWGNKNTKVVFCLNDKVQDGIDPSWIWDANFEAMNGFENKIYVTSTRSDDMALRLKYANINPCLIIMDGNIKNAIQCCFWDLEEKENMLVLTTPSLENEVRNLLR